MITYEGLSKEELVKLLKELEQLKLHRDIGSYLSEEIKIKFLHVVGHCNADTGEPIAVDKWSNVEYQVFEQIRNLAREIT